MSLNVNVGSESKASQKATNATRKLAPDMSFMEISEEEPRIGEKLL